jgi:DNA-binding CsgD family transcriptional regulator
MFRCLKIGTLVYTIACPLTISAELIPDLTPEEEEILEQLKDGTAPIEEVGRQLSNPVGTL